MTTTDAVRQINETGLLGNHVALDFVNTVDWRLAPKRRDLVPDYEVLAHWGRRLGLLSDAELSEVSKQARQHPRKASAALARAVDLREALYRVLVAIAQGKAPTEPDLERLKALFAKAVYHAQLVPAGKGFSWSWAGSDLWERVTWMVASAAVELLSSGDLDRVKQCRDEGCGWLFLDLSKNASRRWCSMEDCGARAKMRRHYRRARSARPGA
jgi:predicted RNA-binding Zn ribbon-like protein